MYGVRTRPPRHIYATIARPRGYADQSLFVMALAIVCLDCVSESGSAGKNAIRAPVAVQDFESTICDYSG